MSHLIKHLNCLDFKQLVINFNSGCISSDTLVLLLFGYLGYIFISCISCSSFGGL